MSGLKVTRCLCSCMPRCPLILAKQERLSSSKATALHNWLRYYEDAQKEVCSSLIPTLTRLAPALSL